MKKRFVLVLVVLLALAALVSCAKKADTAETQTASKTFKVGICNYVDDASLNQIVENLQSSLQALCDKNGYTLVVKYDNCNADSNVMNQIIANFAAEKVDLMVAVATPVAMAMQAATEDSNIPVVFAAVSDPVATQIVQSLENPGKNITGTSDYLNTNAIVNLIFALNPGIKKVGLLYDVGQDASTTAIAQAKAEFEKRGVTVVERTGTNVDEVVLAARALVADKVEAVFTPTDNTIMNAQLSIYEIFNEAKIPHYTGADSFALNGAFLGYGVDYANLGKVTGEMVYDILANGKNPGTVAVKTFDNGTATVNTDTCAALGLSFDEVQKLFAPYCTKVQSIVTAESFGDLK
ncbi:MAG: ABC transporter substrate-binding protein [Sphaerochaetaceae bacterium]|nr:ABC transporter substrate-binding protein [Sphaerochaetaceae bacterium]